MGQSGKTVTDDAVQPDRLPGHGGWLTGVAGGADMHPAAPPEPLPISVLTGFLGSGKTTFLGRLLTRPDMGDTAVVINEFGAVGLDHLLIEAADQLCPYSNAVRGNIDVRLHVAVR